MALSQADRDFLNLRSATVNWIKSLVRDGLSVGMNGMGGDLGNYITGLLFSSIL